MVTLKNKIRQSRVFNLEHANYCSEGKCYCTPMTFDNVIPNYKTGDHNYVRKEKSINDVLRLSDREVKSDLPNTVLKCAEIKGALKIGNLQVVEQTSETKVENKSLGQRAKRSKPGKGSSKSSEAKVDDDATGE